MSGRVRVSGELVKGQTVELILRGDDNYVRPFSSSVSGDHITNDEGVYQATARLMRLRFTLFNSAPYCRYYTVGNIRVNLDAPF